MKREKIYILVIVLLIVLIGGLLFYKSKSNTPPENPTKPDEPVNPIIINPNTSNDFDFKMIKQTNNYYKDNYMISPLSMAYAITILGKGADNNTKVEIDKLLGEYSLGKTLNVKNKISIANLLFVRIKYKEDISPDYIKTIQDNYDSDLIFDKFETPNKANEWIAKKTFDMIKNPIDNLSSDFVLGIANAIAIDVEWKNKFECSKTKQGDFNLDNGEKMSVAYMNSSNDVYYISNENAKGIIKDYAIYDKNTGEIVYEENENTVALQYIAILPNTNITDYINKLDKDELKKLLDTKKESDNKTDIYYSIPKYKYDFDYSEFQNALITLGMKDAFDPANADFNKMINKGSTLGLYVSKAIHKSHIEMNENGTKAAAVTIFILDKNAAYIEPKDKIEVKFDKPFIYIIKEKNSDNIWFFGTVYTPSKWEENVNICETK